MVKCILTLLECFRCCKDRSLERKGQRQPTSSSNSVELNWIAFDQLCFASKSMTKLDFNRQTGRYKNSKNKGARKTVMALQTNALMSTFRYLCTTIKNKVWQFCSTFWHNTSCFNFDERQRESLDHNNMSKVLARHPFSPKDRHCNLGWGAKKEKMFLGILL